MKRRTRLILILCILSASSIDTAFGQASTTIPDDVIASVQERVDRGQNVGIIVGIVGPDTEAYYAYGRTIAGGDAVPDEHSVFEIGSISKVFTAILLADMVLREEVRLDDPVRRYLPESVEMPAWGDTLITLENLSTHMSSLPRLPDNMSPENAANPYADYSVDQIYAFLSRHELRRPIGSQYEYSNLAVGLLGHVLALRRGVSYEELLESRILEVLEMDESGISLTPDMQSHLARGHAGGAVVSNWDIPTLAGAGAIRSTAHDMLRFLAANMDLMDAPASIRIEDNPLSEAMRLSHEIRASRVAGGMSVGLGWHIRHGDGVETLWHNGGTGGYRSFAGFNRDGNLGVVVLTNSSVGADDIGFHMLDPSRPLDAVRENNFPEEIELPPDELAAYAGDYELAPNFVLTITVENGQLHAQATGQPGFPIFASARDEFFWKVVDAQVSFSRDEEGNVVSLIMHQGGANTSGVKTK